MLSLRATLAYRFRTGLTLRDNENGNWRVGIFKFVVAIANENNYHLFNDVIISGVLG